MHRTAVLAERRFQDRHRTAALPLLRDYHRTAHFRRRHHHIPTVAALSIVKRCYGKSSDKLRGWGLSANPKHRQRPAGKPASRASASGLFFFFSTRGIPDSLRTGLSADPRPCSTGCGGLRNLPLQHTMSDGAQAAGYLLLGVALWATADFYVIHLHTRLVCQTLTPLLTKRNVLLPTVALRLPNCSAR